MSNYLLTESLQSTIVGRRKVTTGVLGEAKSTARAIAAVGSDDLDNIGVAIAAQAVAAQVRLLLRAGEHEAIAESRSPLPPGIVGDVASISAAHVVSQLRGESHLA